MHGLPDRVGVGGGADVTQNLILDAHGHAPEVAGLSVVTVTGKFPGQLLKGLAIAGAPR